jgi:hypothetical protein
VIEIGGMMFWGCGGEGLARAARGEGYVVGGGRLFGLFRKDFFFFFFKLL